MAAHIAGLARIKHRSSARRRRMLFIGFAVVLVICIIVGVRTVLQPSNAKAGSVSIQPQLTFGARQAADVNLVAGAIGQYAAANDALPTRIEPLTSSSLVLCSTICNTTNYQVSGLGVYQASDVNIVPYQPELEAPTQSVMYLVPGASCSVNGKLSGINTAPRSMVVLYKVATTTGADVPICQVL